MSADPSTPGPGEQSVPARDAAGLERQLSDQQIDRQLPEQSDVPLDRNQPTGAKARRVHPVQSPADAG